MSTALLLAMPLGLIGWLGLMWLGWFSEKHGPALTDDNTPPILARPPAAGGRHRKERE